MAWVEQRAWTLVASVISSKNLPNRPQDRNQIERRGGLDTAGVHLLCELSDCDPNLLGDLPAVREACEIAAASSGATIIAVNGHAFTPSGVSVLLFLADSHLSIHTWPEQAYAAVDIYTCGSEALPRNAIESLSLRLRAGVINVREFLRGQTGDWPGHRSIEQRKPLEALSPPRSDSPATADNEVLGQAKASQLTTQVGVLPEAITVRRKEMQATNNLVDYRWRAQYYEVEEEDLGDLAYYAQWLLRTEGPTLVIPAGAGRLLPLAQSRLEVFFCDREPAMVQVIRSRLSGMGLSEQLAFQGDMFSLPAIDTYAAIVVPAESTQMFGPELLPQMLAGLSAALKPAGSLVLDLATFDPVCSSDPEAPRYFRPDLPEGTNWKQWRRQAPDGSWVTRHVAHRDNGTHIDFTFTYTIEAPAAPLQMRKSSLSLWRYDQPKLMKLASEAGFECELCETSYATRRNDQGPRLLVTLKKPELR